MNSEDPYSICDEQSDIWRKCIEKELGNKTAATVCEEPKKIFDLCIASWRKAVGPSVRIKGRNEGEPPDQCAAMSCLVGECLRKYNYDFGRCKEPMNCFKHCVKSFYGSEYITE